MMEKVAVIESLGHIDHLIGVMLELGPQWVTYHCTVAEAMQHKDLVDELHRHKIPVNIGDTYQFDGKPYALVEASVYRRRSELQIELKGMIQERKIIYQHGTDDPIETSKNEFCLYVSEHQMVKSQNLFPVKDALYLYDERDNLIWANFGDSEGVVVGPFHIYQKAIPADKNTLRQQIVKDFGFPLKFDLPLIVYFVGQHSIHSEIDETLIYLSKYANIIVKPPFIDITGEEIHKDNIYFLPQKGYSFACNNLLRFAADCLLVCSLSGSFVTSILLGLHVIPIYTQMIDKAGFSGYKLPEHYKTIYDEKMRYISCRSIYEHCSMQRLINNDIMELNATEHKRILDRLQDDAYWQWYDREIPRIRQSVFGYTDPENAAFNAAQAIKRFICFGTFKAANYKYKSNATPLFWNASMAIERGLFVTFEDCINTGDIQKAFAIMNGLNAFLDKCGLSIETIEKQMLTVTIVKIPSNVMFLGRYYYLCGWCYLHWENDYEYAIRYFRVATYILKCQKINKDFISDDLSAIILISEANALRLSNKISDAKNIIAQLQEIPVSSSVKELFDSEMKNY